MSVDTKRYKQLIQCGLLCPRQVADLALSAIRRACSWVAVALTVNRKRNWTNQRLQPRDLQPAKKWSYKRNLASTTDVGWGQFSVRDRDHNINYDIRGHIVSAIFKLIYLRRGNMALADNSRCISQLMDSITSTSIVYRSPWLAPARLHWNLYSD